MANNSQKTNANNQEKLFKVIVIGNSNVGKTTLTYRFCEGKFLNDTEATIGVDFKRKTLEIDGEKITLQLWDTAGQERFRNSMVQNYYRNADAIILVYDVSDWSSFVELKKWVQESNIHCMSDLPKILIGNKCDMPMIVHTVVAQTFADQHNMPLFETSAKSDSHCDNVESIFLTLAHKLKHHRRFLPADDNKSNIRAQVVKNTTDRGECSC